MVKVKPQKITELVQEIFIRENVPVEDASIIAHALVDANLTGRASHGVLRVVAYVDRLEAGGGKARPNIHVLRESDTTAVIDGDNGLGMVAACLASKIAREKAKNAGISCVTVKNTNHYGASQYWAEMIARDDMIAFSCANVAPLVAPPGGKDVALGTNPICIYVPSASYGAMCLDIATSTVAQGKLFDYQLRHQELGIGWAVDVNGIPTTDPDKARFLTPFGAHKGYGIACMVEVMSALLAGGHFGRELNDMYEDIDKPNNLSSCFMAIKIDRFRPVEEFKRDVDRFIEYLHSIPPAEGQRIYFPGEIEQINRARVVQEGLHLPEDLLKQLTDIAVRLGIETVEEYFSV